MLASACPCGVFNTRAREKELETSNIVIVDWCYARRKLNSRLAAVRKKERMCVRRASVCVGRIVFEIITCRTDVIFGYFGSLLSSPVFSILRDGVVISFAKIEKNVEKTGWDARVFMSFQFYFISFYFHSCKNHRDF